MGIYFTSGDTDTSKEICGAINTRQNIAPPNLDSWKDFHFNRCNQHHPNTLLNTSAAMVE